MAQYVIINLETKQKIDLFYSPVQLAVWAPTGNALVYVFENNIYYKSSVDARDVQITSSPLGVSNGVPDWVYEGELKHIFLLYT